MDSSTQGHAAQGNVISEWVWYEGADILLEGEGVCYNTDYGTATDKDGRRNNRVERPSSSNNTAFAGVAARDYSARTGGQFIEIYVPGSTGVSIALGVDTVRDAGTLAFTAGTGGEAGRFVKAGRPGRGTATIRQTVTAVIESSMTGAWSLAVDGITLTVVATAGLAAGDTVVLLGGEDDATGAVVPGKYTIKSVTSGTVLVLATSAVDVTPGGAATCTGYAYNGNPKCQANLDGGQESGGVEFLAMPNAGGVGASSYMANGVSYVLGGVTLGADADILLADGTDYGETKTFHVIGALASNNLVVDLVTPGKRLTGAALNEVAGMDTAGDEATFVWNGQWLCVAAVGNAAEA